MKEPIDARRGVHAYKLIQEQLDALERTLGDLPDRELRSRLIDHLLKLRAECNRGRTAAEQPVACPESE